MTTKHKADYQLLTMYKFVDVDDARAQVVEHKQLCTEIGLRGRVYIGPEGISTTVSGTTRQLRAYRQYLDQHPLWKDMPDIDIKASKVSGHCFDTMKVKYRDEIVAMDHQVSADQVHAAHQEVTVDELKEMIDSGREDVAILDMRNTYEYKLGHFKGAEPAFTTNFREVPGLIAHYKEKYKDKQVVMYCTGGIRCEKLNALLHDEGLTNFYGLNGGVMKYVNTHDDGNREGNLYTFDGRVSMDVSDPIGQCIYTDTATSNCENCRYSPCNARLIATRKAYKQHMGFCSQACHDSALQDLLIKNDDRDPMDYKLLRRRLAAEEISLTDAQSKVFKHIAHRLADRSFRHATSQKEERVDAPWHAQMTCA